MLLHNLYYKARTHRLMQAYCVLDLHLLHPGQTHMHTHTRTHGLLGFHNINMCSPSSSFPNRTAPPATLASFRSHNPRLVWTFASTLPHLTPTRQGLEVMHRVRASGHLKQTHTNRQMQRTQRRWSVVFITEAGTQLVF